MLQEKAFDDGDEWHLLADELSLLPGMIGRGGSDQLGGENDHAGDLGCR